MTSLFLLFIGPSGAASCSAKGSSGNVDKRKRKKRFIRLQVHPYRDSLTGIVAPVSLYLWGSAVVGSSDLFATQQDDLCGQFHVVYWQVFL